MALEGLYSREAALFAALAAWLLGIGTGVGVVLRYQDDAKHAPANATADSTGRAPDVMPPAPSPSPSDWVRPMQMSYQSDCPKIVLREVRVHDDASDRTVSMTMRLTNDHPDRACGIRGDSIFLRDGDGNTFHRQDGGDISVAALGAKAATVTFKVPRTLDIAQFVLPDEQGRLRATDFDLVPPPRGR